MIHRKVDLDDGAEVRVVIDPNPHNRMLLRITLGGCTNVDAFLTRKQAAAIRELLSLAAEWPDYPAHEMEAEPQATPGALQ